MWNWLSFIRHPVRSISDLFGIDWDAFSRARSYLSNQQWRSIAAGCCAVLSALTFVALVVVVGELGELLFTPHHSLDPVLTPITARQHLYAALRQLRSELADIAHGYRRNTTNAPGDL
jgi:diadenosine tetraphosphatase ApaH/serine/threonine PP2A family protein phosphatase